MSESAVTADPGGLVDSPALGITLVFAGISILSVQDVIIRQLGGGYSVLEIMFIRSVVALGPIMLLIRWQGGWATMRMRHPFLIALRGTLSSCSYLLYYMALVALPLADAVAIFFVSPLIITALSVIILGETVGARRWAAILAGFVGAIVIIGPDVGTTSPAAILPLVAAFFYACSVMITRRVGRTQSGASMAFYAMSVYVVLAAACGFAFGDGSLADEGDPATAFLLRGWTVPPPADLALLVLCGLIAGIGFYCLTQGYRVAQASVAAPFEFVAMPQAVVWGLALWGEVPPVSTFLGIALIVGSGVYVLRRESIRGPRLNTGRGIRIRL